MRHRVLATIAAAGVTLLAFTVSKALQSPPEGTRHAFTMIMVHQSPPPGGDPSAEPRSLEKLVAVRSDGSYVTASRPATGDLSVYPQFGDRSLALRPQQQLVYVLDKLRIKTTTPLGTTVQPLAPMDPTCAAGRATGRGPYKFLRTEVFMGYQTYVYSYTIATPGGGEETTTRWFAPALNCRDIQARLDVKDESGTVKTMLNFATSIIEGEPDPALFAVPDGYQEVSPSEMEAQRAQSLGRESPPALLMERLRARDESYFAARKGFTPARH